MNNDTNDKDLRDFFQNRFEHESQEPPREAWVFVKSSILTKTNWWKLGFYFFTGAIAVIFTSLYIYKGTTSSSKIAPNKSTIEKIASSDTLTEQKNTKQDYPISDENKAEIGKQSKVDEVVSNKATKTSLATNLNAEVENAKIKTNKVNTSDNKTVDVSNLPKTKTTKTKKFTRTKVNKVKNEYSKENTTPSNIYSEDKSLTRDAQTAITESVSPKTTNSEENKAEITKAPVTADPEKKDSLAVKEEKTVPLDSTATSDTNPVLASEVVKPTKVKSKWSFDVYAGFGRNTRTIIGNFDGTNNLNLDFSDKRFKLRNRTLGFHLNYALKDYFSVQTGLNAGTNRAKSREFQKTIIKTNNSEYLLNSAEGEMRLEATSLENYYQNSDTVNLKMQFNHRSSYISIPVSCKLSLPNKILAPYIRFGSSFDIETKRSSSVDITKDNVTTNLIFLKPRHKLGRSMQGLLGFGIATNTKFGLNLFLEQQFSFALTPYIIRPNYRVRNAYSQIRFGLSFAF